VFHGWENYFYLVGSAGAGLIGLLFVVVTLAGGRDPTKAILAGGVYMSPTALHFAMVLTLSAMALAPGLQPHAAGGFIGVGAAAGLAAAARACARILGPLVTAPHWSDYLTYAALPTLFYLALAGVAWAAWTAQPWAPGGLAFLLLCLLLLAIRNAWDLVTWIAPRR
jgi:hypothetical protein